VGGNVNQSFNNGDWLFMRYNSDGSLDSTFDGDGKLAFNAASNNEVLEGMTLQPDGRVVGVGFAAVSGDNLSIICRVNGDGTLDSSFGVSGIATYNFIGNASESMRDVIVQPDGKLVAAGLYGSAATSIADYLVARFLPGGSIVTSPTTITTAEKGSAMQLDVA